MAKRTVIIRQTTNGIVTIKVGSYIESIDTRFKSPYEKYETVRWAILTAGLVFTEEIEEMARKVLYA